MRVNALQRPKCSAIECPALSASPCNLHAAIGHLKNQIGYHGIPARVSASGPRGGGGSRSDIQLTHLSDHRINAWPASPVATVPASPAHSPSKRNCNPGALRPCHRHSSVDHRPAAGLVGWRNECPTTWRPPASPAPTPPNVAAAATAAGNPIRAVRYPRWGGRR